MIKKRAGRPSKPPNEKKVKLAITLTPEHINLTFGSRGQRCKIIESALNYYFKSQTMNIQQIIESMECLVGIIEKNVEGIEMSMPESLDYENAVNFLNALKAENFEKDLSPILGMGGL